MLLTTSFVNSKAFFVFSETLKVSIRVTKFVILCLIEELIFRSIWSIFLQISYKDLFKLFASITILLIVVRPIPLAGKLIILLNDSSSLEFIIILK